MDTTRKGATKEHMGKETRTIDRLQAQLQEMESAAALGERSNKQVKGLTKRLVFCINMAAGSNVVYSL